MATVDDTQTRLLDAAGQVFAEVGFRAATIREICRRAGAKNVAAVNYYFREKEQLYRAALQHAFQCREVQMPLPAWPTGMAPEQKLSHIVHRIVEHMIERQQQPWQMQLLLRELAQPTEAGAELVRDFIRPIYEGIWAVVREMLPAAAEDQVHLVAFSIVGQSFYHRVGREVIGRLVGEEEHRTYTAERLANHIVAFSLAAIAGLRKGGERS